MGPASSRPVTAGLQFHSRFSTRISIPSVTTAATRFGGDVFKLTKEKCNTTEAVPPDGPGRVSKPRERARGWLMAITKGSKLLELPIYVVRSKLSAMIDCGVMHNFIARGLAE